MRKHAVLGIAATIALFSISEASAAGRGGGGHFSGGGGGARSAPSRSFAPRTVAPRTFTPRTVSPRVVHPQVPKGQSYRNAGKPAVHHAQPKTGNTVKGPVTHNPGQGSPKMGFVNPGTVKGINKMPHFQPKMASHAGMHGRLAIPPGIRPKLTSLHRPDPRFRARLMPFMQRHWNKAFFWVAVAGIGYLTVPEYLYSWYSTSCVDDDSDYGECADRLAFAAVEEDEEYRVHYQMPSGARYREPVRPLLAPTRQSEAACSLSPFVERQWNKQYVWVKVPQVGNVTVPEDSYDSFVGHAGAEPPRYADACKVLVRAAASDTVETSSMQTTGFDSN